MEPRFEIRYQATYSMIKEMIKKSRLGLRIGIMSVYGLIILYFFCDAVRKDILQQMMPWLMLMVAWLVVYCFLPHLQTKAQLKRIKKQNAGVVPETLVTVDDTIRIHEGMIDMTVDFSKLAKIRKLKYCYALLLVGGGFILVDTNSFVRGNFEELKQFLREKRPDLTIPE